MRVTRKSQYALRGVFELAKQFGQGPVRIADIAAAQAIPKRFLEAILSQLKQAGMVESHRGQEGGYSLARHPRQITVGEVLRFVDGPIGPVDCVTDDAEEACALRGQCVFLPMWQRVQEAVSRVYDTTSFEDLVEEHRRKAKEYVPCYTI